MAEQLATVSSIVPNRVAVGVATPVVITGENLASTVLVAVVGVDNASISSASATEVICTLPAISAVGRYDLSITNGAGSRLFTGVIVCYSPRNVELEIGDGEGTTRVASATDDAAVGDGEATSRIADGSGDSEVSDGEGTVRTEE